MEIETQTPFNMKNEKLHRYKVFEGILALLLLNISVLPSRYLAEMGI